MATIPLPPDFSEFLRLLGEHKVRYLLIGGYAVGYHGHVRGTADIDVWVSNNAENAEKVSKALHDFGFEASPSLIREPDQVIRMGTPPLRIEVLTSVSGVQFDECYLDRAVVDWAGVEVSVIGLDKLKINKAASGRLKDLDDLKKLP